jgi:hypothetical protein
MRTVVSSLVLLVGLVGCASFESIDRSQLNHPAMNLTKDKLLPPSFFLTQLGSIQNSSSGGSCSVCAH